MKIIRIIGLVIIVMVIAGGSIFWTLFSKVLRDGKNLPIAAVDFKRLNDGTYVGEYEGGQYKWWANKVQVTLSSGKLADIKLLENAERRPAEFTNQLYNRVIKSQSLQVDTISGATISSKAYLKAVENALTKAQSK